jgi:hypothetical protein
MTMNLVKFDMGVNANTVERIALRAMDMAIAAKRPRRSKQDYMMDMAAANADVPINLDGLLAASDFDFAHDVFGIEKHLNRETGQLTGCFCPRYAIQG